MGVIRITKEELRQKLEAVDETARPALIDVRLRYPFEHSTIKLPGALRWQPGAPGAAALPKGRDVVLYDSDPEEITSAGIAAVMMKSGYRVCVLKGGLAEWAAASFPIEQKEAVRPAPAPAPAAAPAPAKA